MTEQKKESFYCLLQCSSDAALKQFQAIMKAQFPATHILCQMKQAIDNASRGKPPLIKPPSPDALSLSGDLVNTVVHNWIQNQQKKPAQKPQSVKKNTKANGKQKQQEQQPDSTPRPEPEIPGPNFVYLTDYPKNEEQIQAMVAAATPVICILKIDIISDPQVSDKKGTIQNSMSTDLKTFSSDILPTAQFSLNATGSNEESGTQILNSVHQFYNAYVEYLKENVDSRIVSIPKYPPDPIILPTLPAEKTTAKGSTKIAASSTQQQLEPPTVHDDALKNAYKQVVLNELDEFLQKAGPPALSTQFQHYSELLPKFPLPASLSSIFQHKADFKDPFIFTMRSVAHKHNIPYKDIFSVFVVKKFEEMVGYPIGERRQTETIPLEFLSNIMAPLTSTFPNFKTCDFAGTTLLAFYHSLPNSFPVSPVTETFKLPVTEGFGAWYATKPSFPVTCDDLPPQTEFSANAGYIDTFSNLPSKTTSMNLTRYFDESGLKIETNAPATHEDQSISTSFLVTYNNKTTLAFSMCQKTTPSTNEEEDDSIDVTISVRGSLSKNCEFFFDREPNSSKLALVVRGTRIESDDNQNITMVGAKDESHRVISPDGTLIRFAPRPIIYRTDGSIQTQNEDGTWSIVDKDGLGYVKKEGKWYKDPSRNVEVEKLETYFSSRKVTNFSNGVMFINDDDEETIVFPDGTKYLVHANTYCYPSFPDVHLGSTIVIETNEFKAQYEPSHNVLIETKDLENSMNFLQDSGHLIFYYGQFKNVMTMVDLVTGCVANAGAHRCVYYLNDDWEWVLGRQLCSKKEIVQHFQDGDFVERLQKVDSVDADELTSDISNGHRPRLFIIENDGVVPHVKELISAIDFQAIAEKSSSRISKEGEQDVTFWFDTTPKTYREMTIWTKLTEAEKNQIVGYVENEHNAEKKRKEILSSVGDSKWRELEDQQRKEEEKVLEFLSGYEGVV